MKRIENIKKPNFIKKLFVKLCRIIGFEIIDQSNLYLPTLEKLALRMRKGTYILTLTRQLPSVSKAEFNLEENKDLSW